MFSNIMYLKIIDRILDDFIIQEIVFIKKCFVDTPFSVSPNTNHYLQAFTFPGV